MQPNAPDQTTIVHVAIDPDIEVPTIDPREDGTSILNVAVRRLWFALPARWPDELAIALASALHTPSVASLGDVQSLIAALQGVGLVWCDDD